MTPERNYEDRKVPVMIIKELMESSGSSANQVPNYPKVSAFSVKGGQREQKIVDMNRLRIMRNIDPKAQPPHVHIPNAGQESAAETEEVVHMTPCEYEQLLDKYEEVEDLTCAIC